MPSSRYIGPIFETGIEAPHYFNGRLLTAADLQQNQLATRTRQVWFGTSSGYGIVTGLEVTAVKSNTELRIAPGRCVNRKGQIIQVQAEISLPPLPKPQQGSAGAQGDQGQFSSVKAQTIQPAPVANAGVYLLTVVPIADGYKGTAQAQLATGNVVTASANDALAGPAVTPAQSEVERFRFRIIQLADSNLTGMYSADDLQGMKVNDDNRRNLVAHWCYGTLALQNLGGDPFSFQQQYGDADPLGSHPDLGEDDVPLATFHWNGSALTFVDMWSARRRMIRDAQSSPWQAAVSDKRLAINQARFQQFQDHLNDLAQQSKRPKSGFDLSKRQLTDFFTFLPALGFLPTSSSSVVTRLTQTASGAGKQGGTQTGAGSNLWGTIAGDVAGAVRAINPLHWFQFLQGNVRNNATNIQSMQGQLSTVNEQVQSILDQLKAGQQTAGQGGKGGKGRGSSAGSEESTATGDESNQPTSPLSQEQTQEDTSGAAPADTGQVHPLFAYRQRSLEQIVELLNGKKESGARNFNLNNSFSPDSSQVHLIGSDSIALLIQQSWSQAAMDLRPGSAGQSGSSLLPMSTHLYLVAENLVQPDSAVYAIFHRATASTDFLDTIGANQ